MYSIEGRGIDWLLYILYYAMMTSTLSLRHPILLPSTQFDRQNEGYRMERLYPSTEWKLMGP